jgi:hypothetical protein
MQKPAYYPLHSDRYNHLVVSLTFPGKDLTGCTLHGQIRPKVNATTGAVVDLPQTTNPVISGLKIEAASMEGSVVRLCVIASDLASFISSTDEDDVIARYDIKVLEADGFTENIWLYGPFIIRAGVDNA